MRLQKYMAMCGVASRRKSEALIAEGAVSVNGAAVLEPGISIDPEKDEVRVRGKAIALPAGRYILLNKPKGVVSTAKDAHADKTVVDLVGGDERLYPVGRLDKDTEGLLILTNDGDLTFRLTHPSHQFAKTYRCMVAGHVDEKTLQALAAGVVIDCDGTPYRTRPAEVEVLRTKRGATVLQIVIGEGKKRQIRKMCDAVGHPVIQLRRIALGDIRDDALKVGQWRELHPDEIDYLKGV